MYRFVTRSAAFLALTGAAAAMPALAQTRTAPAGQSAAASAVPVTDAQAETGQPPKRIRQVTLTGNQPCPQSSSEEVVVCAHENPADQYRIPKRLRDSGPIPAQNQSWTNRAAVADQTSRVAAGLPNTCSPIGTGGQTGCSQQIARDFAAERRANQQDQAQVP
jgi:hypothetical protein